MTADAETMREVIGWLRTEHGGFEQYMLDHGLALGELELLRSSLIDHSMKDTKG
jgi:hypothetical protein